MRHRCPISAMALSRTRSYWNISTFQAKPGRLGEVRVSAKAWPSKRIDPLLESAHDLKILEVEDGGYQIPRVVCVRSFVLGRLQ